MAVGKTILHFTNVHDQGGAFNSDSLNGTPILLKCFPDHCWPYRRRQTELQADFGERGAKMPTTSTDLCQRLYGNDAALMDRKQKCILIWILR